MAAARTNPGRVSMEIHPRVNDRTSPNHENIACANGGLYILPH